MGFHVLFVSGRLLGKMMRNQAHAFMLLVQSACAGKSALHVFVWAREFKRVFNYFVNAAECVCVRE